jgi:hypothetical protein
MPHPRLHIEISARGTPRGMYLYVISTRANRNSRPRTPPRCCVPARHFRTCELRFQAADIPAAYVHVHPPRRKRIQISLTTHVIRLRPIQTP